MGYSLSCICLGPCFALVKCLLACTCMYVVIQGQYLAVGTNDSTVQIWDATTEKRITMLRGHHGRVGKNHRFDCISVSS